MPRGKGARAPGGHVDVNAGRRYYTSADAPWGGFVDLRLSEGERGDYDAWLQADAPAIWEEVGVGLVDGLSLSVKYDAQNECFTASLLGKGFGSSPDRHCLVARGATWSEAVSLAWYKHSVLMDGDWSAYLSKTGGLNKFG